MDKIIFKRKAFISGGSLVVPIPKEIVDTLNLSPGDKLELWLEDGNIRAKKINNDNNGGVVDGKKAE